MCLLISLRNANNANKSLEENGGMSKQPHTLNVIQLVYSPSVCVYNHKLTLVVFLRAESADLIESHIQHFTLKFF